MRKLRRSVSFKSIFGTVLLLLFFAGIVSIIGYNGFTDSLLEQFADDAFHTADAAAFYVDADRMEAYKASGGTTEEYIQIYNTLDTICNTLGVTFIYVIEPDLPDYDHITFIFSGINHSTDYTHYDFLYYRETTNDDYRTKYRQLYEGEADRAVVVRDKGYIETGSHITAMIPLKGSDGQTKAILCVQRQMDILTSVRRSFINKIVLTMLALSILVIVGQSIYLRKVLIAPLQRIKDEAARFAIENTAPEKRLSDTIRDRDEIWELAESIDLMETQVRDYVEDLTRVTAENERIGTELTLANRIQSEMLPNIFPAFPERKEFDIYASMDPAKEVGGDFYDFFLLDEDHLGLVMADVSGKGVPAALFMMVSKILIQNYAMLGYSPGKVLETVNALISSNNREDMFITVWLGFLDLTDGKIIAANAGHEYPILKRPDGGFELVHDKHGFVIGGMSGMKYREYELQLEPGATLFLYTDGLPEATNSEGVLFGTDRVLDTLNSLSDPDPKTALEVIDEAVDVFVGEAEQFDDLTMLCLQYRGKAAEDEADASAVKEMTVNASTGSIDRITQFVNTELDAAGCSFKVRSQIDVAIDEIFSNISHYAYENGVGKATVRFELLEDPSGAALTFIDKGKPYDPLAADDPDITLTAEERQIGGLGILLVKKSMDDVRYEYKDGQNILRIEKRF